ncbi:hypothetical protein EDD85DRAFT_969100 [Armillaria nabsnona]|nr:hypothetical protein EDD85DRAFT_969100 [Armillaria nabsnona]
MFLHNPSATSILQPNTVISSYSINDRNFTGPSAAHEHPQISDLFALVIGIDEISAFQRTKQIYNFRNEQATKVTIETEIEELGKNPAIKKGAPILIFYAGHGAEANAPSEWPSANGKIQMLVPHDFIPSGSSDSKQGQGVLDVRLSHLLADLAAKKSDNITVILDCCHSGSGTRGAGNDPTFAVRGIDLPETYTVAQGLLDDIEPDARASAITKGFQRKEKGIDELTYTDVVKELSDLPKQNPQCKGSHTSRYLFNSNEISKLYRIRASSDSDTLGQYVLEAGEVHGITKDTQFDVFTERTMLSKLGTVIVSSTTTSTATCNLSGPGMPFSLGYALQTGGGEGQIVNLLLKLDSRSRGIWDKAVEGMENKGKGVFRLVKKSKEPDLVVTADHDVFHFEIMEKDCRRYGLTRMPFEVKFDHSDTIPHILQSSAHFYWHLHRSGLKGRCLAGKVTLECMKLQTTGELTDELKEVWKPDPDGDNLNSGGVIMVDVGENYGFKLTNTTLVPLYVSMFYFDVSGLSIVEYYTPGSAKRNADAPLPPKQSLILGHGESGQPPLRYFLREGQSVDVGFLKLFISTESIDMLDIAQQSLFSLFRMTATSPSKKLDLWDTMRFTLVQTKK